MVLSAKTQMAQRNSCLPCLMAVDHYADDDESAKRQFASKRSKVEQRRHTNANEKRRPRREDSLTKAISKSAIAKRQNAFIHAYKGDVSPVSSSNGSSSSCGSSASSAEYNLKSKSRGLM